MLLKSKYTLYFYTLLCFIVCLLFIQVQFYLSISYKEALNLYENSSLLSFITRAFIYCFGQNDIALRLPFIILYILSVILMYKITQNYFKYESDRFISICIFMLLPGVISASLLVNTAIICTFFVLLYIYYYQKYNKHLYYLLPLLLFIDNSFAIMFLGLFFFAIKTKDAKLIYFSAILFSLSLFIYGVSTNEYILQYYHLFYFYIFYTLFIEY